MQNAMKPTDDNNGVSVLGKAFALMRALACAPAEGAKITLLAQDTGISQGQLDGLGRHHGIGFVGARLGERDHAHACYAYFMTHTDAP